jgi:hypothetical protein
VVLRELRHKLYEEFVEVTNIETQLPPVFDRFFGSARTAPARTAARSWNSPQMIAELNIGGQKIRAALDRGVSLAIAVEFGSPGRGISAPARRPRRRSRWAVSPAASRPARSATVPRSRCTRIAR